MKRLVAVCSILSWVACSNDEASSSKLESASTSQTDPDDDLNLLQDTIIVVGVDGDKDHGEVNAGTEDALKRCLLNRKVKCVLVIPTGDKDYDALAKLCRRFRQCSVRRYPSDEYLKNLLAEQKADIGILVAHHTGDGLWNCKLSAEEIDLACNFPMVVRACFSKTFCEGHDGLFPVGEGLLRVNDLKYVEVVKNLLMNGVPSPTPDPSPVFR